MNEKTSTLEPINPKDYGIRRSAEQLNEALVSAIQTMERSLQGHSSRDLTAAEAAYFRTGGLVLEAQGADPIGQTAVEFAALIKTSLSSAEVAKQLSVHGSKVRQLIMKRRLFSFIVDGRRYIPAFQFLPDGTIVPGIQDVNEALDASLHPVEVFTWYTTVNPDLFVDDEQIPVSPIDWLKAGYSVDRVVELATDL